MNYNQYYNEIDTEALIRSPQWIEVNTWSETFNHEPTESELLELGVYVEGNSLMKNFTMSINGNPCDVKVRMTVQPVAGQEEYVVESRGVSIDISVSDFIEDCSTGLGFNIDDYTKTDIISSIIENYSGHDIDVESMVINGIIDIYGQSAYDYNLMDLIYNYFEQFPNLDNPCVVIQQPLPEGQSFVTTYDHSSYLNNIVALDDGNTAPGYTSLQLKNHLDYLYEHDSNFKSIIDNSQVVRTCFNTVAPKITRMYVNGYTLENASIVTTNEIGVNQHYSGLVTHVKGGRWATSPYDFGDDNYHNEGFWDQDVDNVGVVLYNYYREYWFNATGLNNTALVGSGPIIDSIGITSTLNPVTPISNVHTKWYEPDVNDVYKPLGHKPIDPTVPDIEKQTIVRQGKPPVIIKPRPIIGAVPQPYIDPVSPETFDEWVDIANRTNMYHPTTFEVDDLFDWLWDRDTWHDAQEMNSDPMEVIISLHTLPLPNQVPYNDAGDTAYWYAVSDGSPIMKPIVLGYLTAQTVHTEPQSDLTSAIITQRVCHFCFGHVYIPRTYLDYRDYEREIYIYLPYVGFKQLRADDVTPWLDPFIETPMVALYLDYFIDVATGDFQAIISIDKNKSDKKVLYMFSGNMATSIPLRATDKTRLEQAKFNTYMSIGTTALSLAVATGATLTGNLPVAATSMLGVAGGLGKIASGFNAMENQNVISVNRSGSLASNAGALAPKTPYVVINTPIAYDTTYGPYSANSANVTTRLGVLKGFVKCKYVHVDTLASITLEESDEIEKALLDGVIF